MQAQMFGAESVVVFEIGSTVKIKSTGETGNIISFQDFDYGRVYEVRTAHKPVWGYPLLFAKEIEPS